jgi:hypothetical protein
MDVPEKEIASLSGSSSRFVPYLAYSFLDRRR